MAEYNKKWQSLFPAAIGNQNRPADGVDNTLPYETDKFPQHIANDPVRYDKMNAVVSQSMSNDERLNEKIKRTSDDLAAHNKDPKAHATGIAGNAATASKLATPRTLSLTGNASGSATFDGSANATINVTSVNADTASKLSTARKISITGNATGAANFDGSADANISVTVNESKHATAADTATKVNATATNGGAADLVFGTMAANDYARIRVGGSDDNGWLELATADGGNEPIYARQYGGAYDWPNGRPGTVKNEAVLLDGNGNTKFPHDVTAANFKGHLAGNADSATNADTVDGVHAGSMFYNKGNWAADNWATIGTYHVNNQQLGDNWYQWGQVISSSTNYARFQLYASDNYGGDGRLHYRTGWSSRKNQWNTILDSENYNEFVPTKTGGGASGTWGISITGNAASATTATKANTAAACTGNSATASKLATARSIALTGNATGSANFDGSGNISISTNVNTATNADKLDGYHASDLISKIQDITPKGAAALGQFRKLIVNDSHQIKLPDGGTWAYFVYCYTSWSGDDSNGEHRTRTGAGIAAGGTVLHTDGSINSSTINNYHLTGTTSASGADGNNMIVGGFCWRIA